MFSMMMITTHFSFRSPPLISFDTGSDLVVFSREDVNEAIPADAASQSRRLIWSVAGGASGVEGKRYGREDCGGFASYLLEIC
jgi:hypothetical protein